jgi:hypothetical protein
MDRFTEEPVKAGIFVAAAGLKNTADAKRIVVDGDDRTVTDGPFAVATAHRICSARDSFAVRSRSRFSDLSTMP